MHGNPCRQLTTRQEDDIARSGVLKLVLGVHPTQLSVAEVLSEVGDNDSHQQAVEDLVRVGLLRRVGDSVLPTRAALVFEAIK